MQRLLTGIHHFQNHVFGTQAEMFESLADGQQPLALFITCSDSRICPNLLTQTRPGELFILRVAGNVIPPFGAPSAGEAATIEYAVSVLKVRDIIVCGHSLCGAVKALLGPARELEHLPAVKNALQYAESTRRIISENYSDVSDSSALLSLAIQENVLVQLENLRTHPCVAAALGRNEISLHGWVYKFQTGQVFAFCPRHEQFLQVEQVHLPVQEVSPRPELMAI
jgi:carbonic anhydrase